MSDIHCACLTHLFCISETAVCAHISQISELQSDQAVKPTATIHSFVEGYLTEYSFQADSYKP